MKTIKIERGQYSITAKIQRPEAKNAVNFTVMEELETLLHEIESDEELRLFTLQGSEGSFISGGDLREFHQIKDALGAKKMTRRMISILERIENLTCWTLAAVNGHAYGGGWETMLSFDFRVASASAKIGFTQGKFYLPPGWGGITKLSNAVGRDLAMYWLASQSVISTETALRAGLIQDLFQDDEFDKQLKKLQSRLQKNDRQFIEYIKRKDISEPGDEIDPFSRFWESDEHHQRVEEFLNRGSG